VYPQIFGKYVLEGELARGGMARLMLATLRGAGGFEKKLVVKQIRDELASDDAFVKRFVDEAKTTVALSHPNIVPVYELGVEQGTYFLAMELVEGVSIAELLDGGVLSPEQGAYVGAEVRNGEVHFVTNGGDHRLQRTNDGPRHKLLIERPKVLKRTAPARDENHIHVGVHAEKVDARRNLSRRTGSLNFRWMDQYMERIVPSLQNREHIAKCGTGRRRDDPDTARQRGKRPLSFGSKQPLFLQPFLELLEGELKRPETGGLENLDDQLIFTAAFICRDPTTGAKTLSVFRFETEKSRGIPKTNCWQLRAVVFQSEVEMTGGRTLEVGDFAFDPHIGEPALQHLPKLGAEFGYGINPALKIQWLHAREYNSNLSWRNFQRKIKNFTGFGRRDSGFRLRSDLSH